MPREKTLARQERGELEQYEPWNTFRDMERMFRDFFTTPFPALRRPWLAELRHEFVPEVDLRETEKEYILTTAVPGLERDDIEIDVTKDHITVTGERKVEEERPGETYHFRQQSHGSFRISYGLPAEVKAEEVKAVYRNGILEVTMPKAEVTEAHKVQVEVKE